MEVKSWGKQSFHSQAGGQDQLEECQNESQPASKESYREYAQILPKVEASKIKLIQVRLRERGISWTDDYCPTFWRLITDQYLDSSQVHVRLGHFSTTLYVCESQADPPNLYRPKIGEGQFASVYRSIMGCKADAVKSFKVVADELNHKADAILREVFMLKLAAALEVGPNYQPIYGYDVMLYKNTAEISMELCGPAQSVSDKSRMRDDLLANLAVMHHFGMVHRDVKTENIGWSASLKKWVFLDFGFSSFIRERPGQKTLTSFIGTYGYASPEMGKLFFLKEKRMVDLFYNDFFGVKSIIKKLEQKDCDFQNRLTAEQSQQQKKDEYKWYLFYNFQTFSFLLFSHKEEEAQQFMVFFDEPAVLIPAYHKFKGRDLSLSTKKRIDWLNLPQFSVQQSRKNHKILSQFQSEFHQTIFSQRQESQTFSLQAQSLIECPQQIKRYWYNTKSNQRIFSFIFSTYGNALQKKQLITNICKVLCADKVSELKSDLQRVLCVLNLFSTFFQQNRNIARLREISVILAHLGQQAMEYRSDEKIIEFLLFRSPKNTLLQALFFAEGLCWRQLDKEMFRGIRKETEATGSAIEKYGQIFKQKNLKVPHVEQNCSSETMKDKFDDSACHTCIKSRWIIRKFKELVESERFVHKIHSLQQQAKQNALQFLNANKSQFEIGKDYCYDLFFGYKESQSTNFAGPSVFEICDSYHLLYKYDRERTLDVIKHVLSSQMPQVLKLTFLLYFLKRYFLDTPKWEMLSLVEAFHVPTEISVPCIVRGFDYKTLATAFEDFYILECLLSIDPEVLQAIKKKIKLVLQSQYPLLAMQPDSEKKVLKKCFSELVKVKCEIQVYSQERYQQKLSQFVIKLTEMARNSKKLDLLPFFDVFPSQNAELRTHYSTAIIEVYEFWKQEGNTIFLNKSELKGLVAGYLMANKFKEIILFFFQYRVSESDMFSKFDPNLLGKYFLQILDVFPFDTFAWSLHWILEERRLQLREMSPQFQYSHLLYHLSSRFCEAGHKLQRKARTRVIKLICFGTSRECIYYFGRILQEVYVYQEFLELFSIPQRKHRVIKRKIASFSPASVCLEHRRRLQQKCKKLILHRRPRTYQFSAPHRLGKWLFT